MIKFNRYKRFSTERTTKPENAAKETVWVNPDKINSITKHSFYLTDDDGSEMKYESTVIVLNNHQIEVEEIIEEVISKIHK